MLYLNSAAIVTSEVYLYHLQNSLTQKIALAVYANAIFVWLNIISVLFIVTEM